MEDPKITYWSHRVMRHRSQANDVEYAVHEVYFDGEDRATGWTKDAVSPRMISVAALREWIVERLALPDDGVSCGGQGYTYHHADFEMWLRCFDKEPLEYDSDL